ncbi:tricarballylate dehydrogenase [Roseovarius albus]|uniref:Tricarballylate dehydrogenase n=1 Tax=Roseovarius albus TaxID=1247867 RepID=A0A1X6Y9I7_9RHOB|nr:NAD(P)/FAD-dependent oxidoreductase [Roseovarius albus]SLN14605.1 tricarballylate dehydrogenase [Roseovarius albus]
MSNSSFKTYDAIVLGAGGAGLMCAAIAGQRGKRVLVIDHASKPGKKILISGGGRCNFTNIDARAECYLSQNRHFGKSALGRYTAQDFIDLVNKHKIAWHEKELGQLFCDDSARQIVKLLLDECAKGDVTIQLGQPIRDVSHSDARYTVTLDTLTATAPALVIATGGPSIPKMGATDFAFHLARQFELKIVEPRPALVPLTLGEDELLFRNLSGVSTDAVARHGKTKFRAGTLFTHKGLSGPSILQISSYWRKGEQIGINFLPDHSADWLIDAKKAAPRSGLKTALATAFPDRLATALAEKLALPGEMANIPDKKLRAAHARLSDWPFTPTGSEGYAKAEVTLGGINTNGLSSQTMESKHLPGLYAIGEAVDVTGWLGGYNFQWAWSSGWAAGMAL